MDLRRGQSQPVRLRCAKGGKGRLLKSARGRHMLRYMVAALMAGAVFAPAKGADAVPDFAGAWGRNAFNFEEAASGPRPVTNLRRVGADAGRRIEGGDSIPLVGDY